ncbi:MAG TPA: hypothetical protein DCL60_09780 [Armatimonadetes bacterium]|nr:hypothetical protein [Armatimonadota bacterium]
MKKWMMVVLCLIGIVAASQAGADVVPNKVIAHCQDQGNYFANDPKWLFGERTVGQSFTPSKDKLSLLSAKIYRRKPDFQDSGSFAGNANLEIRLWECKENYAATKNSQPLFSTTDEKKPAFADNFYFPMNVNTKPGTPYYFEFSVPLAPEKCYYYWYQYGGSFYPGGDFTINGARWGTCDFNFTTYYPVEISKGQEKSMDGLPEILEIQLSGKVNSAGIKAMLSGPSGIIKAKTSYGDDNTVYLGPLTLPAYNPGKSAYKLIVQIKGESGNWQNFEYPFTYELPAIEPATDVKATANDSGVTLTWKPSPSAAEYRIYRFTESGKMLGRATRFIARVKGDQTSYQDPAKNKDGKALLEKGITYYYRVLALDKSLSKTGLSQEKEIAIP